MVTAIGLLFLTTNQEICCKFEEMNHTLHSSVNTLNEVLLELYFDKLDTDWWKILIERIISSDYEFDYSPDIEVIIFITIATIFITR